MSKSASNAATSRYELYTPHNPRASGDATLETVIRPGRLFGSNGIRWAPDGTLWVTELVGDQITSWDPENDFLRVASPMGSELSGPDDIAFDAAGNVYATETMNSRVSGRRANGEYFVLLDDVPAPNGITIDPLTDDLYIDEMREGGRVLRVDKEQPNTLEVVTEGLAWLNALEMGPDRELFLPQVLTGEILAVNADTGATRIVAEGLSTPTAVKFDSQGRVIVSEAGSGAITALEENGTRTTLAEFGLGIDNFCFDPQGNLYVSSFIEAKIVRYSAGTSEIDRVLSLGGLMGPYQVAAAADGTVLVADANSIVRVTPDAALERIARLLITMPFVAIGIALVPRGAIALSLAGDVFRLDLPSGEFTKIYTATSEATDQYMSTEAAGVVALAADGDLVLGGKAGGGTVLEMALDGTVTGERSTSLTRLTSIAARGGLLVASDEEGGTVAVVSPHGTRMHNGFNRPQGVCITAAGVFVAERGTRSVVLFDLESGERTTVAEDLAFGLPTAGGVSHGRLASLSAEPDGSVLVGCDGDGSIRRLTVSL